MPKYSPQPPIDGIPANTYNDHCWITGEPEIGEGTWIGPFTLIDGQGGLTIGRGVNISTGASILTHNTVKRCVTERSYDVVDRASTVVEDYVFIGENAVILMGSKIGHHSVIGAGAVVLENSIIPPYSLAVGVPARVVKSLEQEIEKWKKEAVSTSQ